MKSAIAALIFQINFLWDPGYNFNSLIIFNFSNLLSYQTESHLTLFRLLILRQMGVSYYCMLLIIYHMTVLQYHHVVKCNMKYRKKLTKKNQLILPLEDLIESRRYLLKLELERKTSNKLKDFYHSSLI